MVGAEGLFLIGIVASFAVFAIFVTRAVSASDRHRRGA